MKKLQRLFHLLRITWLMLRIRKSKNKETQHAARKALAAQLAGGRGLPMKIGQVMAGMDDNTDYQALTQSVQPWALRDMQPVMEQAWGKPLPQVLSSIKESQAAASLGQVHQGEDLQGNLLAIKVQYPDIKHAIAAEMSLAGLMPRGGPVKKWDFDLAAYKTTLQQNMLFELDYLHEKQQQIAFYEMMHVDGLHVPAIVNDLCRPNVLVQAWAYGERLSVAKGWGKIQRLQIAKILMMTMFQSLLETGLVHGDPHPGNVLFQQGGDKASVTLLDFGCMVHVEESRRLVLLQLMLACRGECNISPLDGFVALGFDAAKLQLIQDKLPDLMAILFRPFVGERPFDLQHWHPGQEVEALLAEQRWIFRAAGPADLFLIMRVFQGLVQQLVSLDTQLPWWSILQQAVSQKVLAQARAHPLNKQERVIEEKVHGSAKVLHIRITESEKEKAHIQLPAASALQLADLMPDEAKRVLHAQNISLQAIAQRLIAEGVDPQQLVDMQDHGKRYQLWLE